MCEVLQQQGGEPTEIDDPNCTHVVSFLLKYSLLFHFSIQLTLTTQIFQAQLFVSNKLLVTLLVSRIIR